MTLITVERVRRVFSASILRSPETTIATAIVILSIIIGLVNPTFWTSSNWFSILRWFIGLALLSIGQSMVLIAGGIDLSVGSMASLSSMLFAYFLEIRGMDVGLAMILVLLIAASIGIYHGLFIALFSPPMPTIVPAFIVTLGSMILLSGLAIIITLGWPIPIKNPEKIAFISSNEALLLIFFIAIATAIFIQRRTAVGRFLYAIGGNIEAARVAGIPIHKARIFAYVFSSILASIAGIIFTSLLSSGYPAAGAGQELYSIASNAIGGVSLAGGEGNALGAILGALMLSIIRNGLVLMGVSPYWQDSVAGIILVAAVASDLARRLLRK